MLRHEAHKDEQEARHRRESSQLHRNKMFVQSMQGRSLAQLTNPAYAKIASKFRAQYGEEAFITLAKSQFKEADVDGNGTVEKAELGAVLNKCGLSLSDDELAAMLSFYDIDSNEHIDEAEWTRLVCDLLEGSFDSSRATQNAKAEAYKPLSAAPVVAPKAKRSVASTSVDAQQLRQEVNELQAESEKTAAKLLAANKKLEAAKKEIAASEKAHQATTKALASVSERLAKIEGGQ